MFFLSKYFRFKFLWGMFPRGTERRKFLFLQGVVVKPVLPPLIPEIAHLDNKICNNSRIYLICSFSAIYELGFYVFFQQIWLHKKNNLMLKSFHFSFSANLSLPAILIIKENIYIMLERCSDLIHLTRKPISGSNI